jgi:hypothetical protein
MMRAIMGIVRNRHGTYEARKKVPKRFEHATAQVLEVSKTRQSWLKKSLARKTFAKPAHGALAEGEELESNILRRGAYEVAKKLGDTTMHRDP